MLSFLVVLCIPLLGIQIILNRLIYNLESFNFITQLARLTLI